MNTISILFFFFFFSFLLLCIQETQSQQTYINNKQLACYTNNDTTTNGYLCKGPQTSCLSYLTFRSQPPYDSASDIGYLLHSDASQIAELNNITDVEKIPINTLVMVPITNCSCSGKFYQYNSNYTLKNTSETYFSVANNTYQGLTTCQALMDQNSYDSRNLSVRLRLTVPVRCACPSREQTADGVGFLLSYLVTWRDSVSEISKAFGVDEESVLTANELSEGDNIYPFTPILIPLKSQPTYNPNPASSPPAQPPPITDSNPGDSSSSSSSKKWVFVGIGVGVGLLLLVLLSGVLFWCLRRRRSSSRPASQGGQFSVSTDFTTPPEKKSDSFVVSSENVRFLIDSSLSVYNFVELQNATKHFSEDNIIKGSVYRGEINGDNAAIKRINGSAFDEINILKQISHSSIIRLSGYCLHDGNTYLVYEFAENGSLGDLLQEEKLSEKSTVGLGWKQRIQIAYDVADGLNYLHNYANPPYIHKDLKSSNILLNGNFRAKIANFGMSRTVDSEEGEEQGMQLTRHVVGTQGYMAPEYIENGVVTPKMDVFAFGVVLLELLSGKEAATSFKSNGNDGKPVNGEKLLFASIKEVLDGENVREKLKNFMDPHLRSEYPLDLAFSMAELAKSCVAPDMNARPTMVDVFITLSKIHSSSLDWDPSDEFQHSRMASDHDEGEELEIHI